MKFEIIIKKACEGFWRCLTPTDYIQIISVFIAMVTTVIALVTVIITRKQYREESEDRKRSYKPLFKINRINGINGIAREFWFVITNEGFPFYIINKVEWIGEGVSIKKHLKGLVSEKKNNEVKKEYEAYSIIIKINTDIETEGCIKISGFDFQNNCFSVETPIIKIKNGKIINDVDLTFQYLK